MNTSLWQRMSLKAFFGPATLWRASLWRCDFLAQLVFSWDFRQNNLKCMYTRLWQRMSLKALFWSCDSLTCISLTLHRQLPKSLNKMVFGMGNCLTHLDVWNRGIPAFPRFSSISPIQTRWISGVWEADLSEQILRILGFSSNFCHRTRWKPGVLEYEKGAFQSDSCESLGFVAISNRHGGRTIPILGCVGLWAGTRKAMDERERERERERARERERVAWRITPQKSHHDMQTRTFWVPKKWRQKTATASAEKSRHLVHSGWKPLEKDGERKL